VRTNTELARKEEDARVEKEKQKAMAAKEQALVGNEIEAMIQMSLKTQKKTGPAENLIMMSQDKDDIDISRAGSPSRKSTKHSRKSKNSSNENKKEKHVE